MTNLLNFYRKNTATIILDICDYQFNDGDTIYLTVKTQPDNDQTDSDALIKASWVIGEDVEIDEVDNMLQQNTINLNLSAAETDIDFGQYFYDLKIVTEDGVESTLITGNINILKVATLRV